ncbi:MAG TPA: putative zinc-binding protein [bacterium]|nr:putative zinc-binding protein [bacterium]HOL35252.1 putative zinc-binding protein [bacterium]HPP08711.1 putative zinc-binding protein [bacterium]
MAEKCCCGGPLRLLFPCAGGSDVGALTDRVARKLTQDGWGKIYCLAGVAAHIPSFLENTKAAEEVVAIDGCPVACASKALIHAGYQPISISLQELGFMKGKSIVSEENINKILELIKKQDIPQKCNSDKPDSQQTKNFCCSCDEENKKRE